MFALPPMCQAWGWGSHAWHLLPGEMLMQGCAAAFHSAKAPSHGALPFQKAFCQHGSVMAQQLRHNQPVCSAGGAVGSTGESSPCCHAAFRWVTKMKVQLSGTRAFASRVGIAGGCATTAVPTLHANFVCIKYAAYGK